MKELEPFHYYQEYELGILLAKRGGWDRTNDVYHYDEKKKKWLRFSINEREWCIYAPIIFESCEINEEHLKKFGIPLVEDNIPDITTRILEELKKAKGKNGKNKNRK